MLLLLPAPSPSTIIPLLPAPIPSTMLLLLPAPSPSTRHRSGTYCNVWAYYPEVLLRAKGPAAALEWMNAWKDSTDNMIYSEEGKGGGRKGRGARALLILGMVSECLQGRWWVAYAHTYLWYPWGVSVWVGPVMPAAVAQACTASLPWVCWITPHHAAASPGCPTPRHC
jgi:hypothetical protein